MFKLHPPYNMVGLLGVLAYPLVARNTFIDENALLPGQTMARFGRDVQPALICRQGLTTIP